MGLGRPSGLTPDIARHAIRHRPVKHKRRAATACFGDAPVRRPYFTRQYVPLFNKVPTKGDLHRWRETFADKLRGWGVEAEATRQATRGEQRRYATLWQVKAEQEGIWFQLLGVGRKRGR